MDNTTEIWKEIPDYPGDMVSNLGRISSPKHTKKFPNERYIIYGATNKLGYLRVKLRRPGHDADTLYIHRLVALAFIPNDDPSRDTVDHINGDKLDNRAENLQWLSRGDNTRKEKGHKIAQKDASGATIQIFPSKLAAREYLCCGAYRLRTILRDHLMFKGHYYEEVS